MTGKHKPIIDLRLLPLPGRSWRWVPWAAYVGAGVGYLSGVLTTQPLTLLSLLLLTGIYGAWVVLVVIAVRGGVVAFHPGLVVLALFCLACASQFVPLPGTNTYWLPLLPVMTTGVMAAIKPRALGLLATGALCLSSYLAVRHLAPDWDVNSQVDFVISFLSTFAFWAIIRALAAARAALEGSNAELAAAHTRLQEYSAQAEELSVIRERNRIAREIHDTLGHALTLLAVQLETATQHEARGDARLHEDLLEARRVAKACLTDVRHSVEALRPDDASAGSLQEQLCRLVAACEATSPETMIALDLEEAMHPLHPEMCLALYRCAQEALTNIRKHAHATKVLLRLSMSGGQEDQVELTVLDNGQGSPSGNEDRVPGFGLQGMRERVALLGGALRVGPEPGHGWRVEVVIPVKPPGQAEAIATPARAIRVERELWQSGSGC
jgi:signal transduction histidine kinase